MNEFPLLKKENIYVHCASVTRHQAILDTGQILIDDGYVKPGYLQGMLNRDESLSVYIGNMLAIPHGEHEVKDEILHSGLVVRIYPDGIDWGGNLVKIVIGIAALGEQHMTILANCAYAFEDIANVERVVQRQDRDWIYRMLVEGELV